MITLDRQEVIDNLSVSGTYRFIKKHGRVGLNLTSHNGFCSLGDHNLADEVGAVACWFMPMFDFNTWQQLEQHKMTNSQSDYFVLLSDHQAVSNFEAASFALAWHSSWHPCLVGKRYIGSYYPEAFAGEPKAWAAAGYAEFKKLQWYQMVFTWDWKANECKIFVNGVLVGHSDKYAKQELAKDPVSSNLYIGNQAMAISQVEFRNTYLSEKEAGEWFLSQNTADNPDEREELNKIYTDAPDQKLQFSSGEGWQNELKLSLKDKKDLDAFYVQGCHYAPQVSNEGLRVTTLMEEPKHIFNGGRDHGHVYLWSHKLFEGDLYVRYKFKVLKRGGLGILMTNCSGMDGSDFHQDRNYPVSGMMKTVCWEDVRNYHWEYYREMNDVRNDCVSHAILKNPWFCPVGFKVVREEWDLDQWYTLEYLQVGEHIQAAINGNIVIDWRDSAATNNGPVLDKGRIALRLMRRTDMMFKNLEVWNKPKFEVL